jgi:hypothetical protein
VLGHFSLRLREFKVTSFEMKIASAIAKSHSADVIIGKKGKLNT